MALAAFEVAVARTTDALRSLVRLPPDAEFVGYQEDHGTLSNNFLAVVPNHPVICLALQLASEAVNRRDSDSVWLYTCSGALSLLLRRLFQR